MWIVFALLAAVFAGTSITLTKAGLGKVDPILAFAIQTLFILAISWGVVLFQKSNNDLARIDRKAWLFICLAGIATCCSSLFQFKALKLANASMVTPLTASSLIFTVLFAGLFLKEQINWKIILGVSMIIGGTVLVSLSRK
jgi:bacterial/archaeal transporter family protein